MSPKVLGPLGLGTEDGDSGAVGGVNSDSHSQQHRGLRTEVSDLGPPRLGFPGPGAQGLQTARWTSLWWNPGSGDPQGEVPWSRGQRPLA